MMRENDTLPLPTLDRPVGPRAAAAMRRYGLLGTGTAEGGHHYEFKLQKPAFSRMVVCLDGPGEVLMEGVWRACPPGTAYATPPFVVSGHRSRASWDTSKTTTRWGVAWVRYELGRCPAIERLERPTCFAVDPSLLQMAIAGLRRESEMEAQADAMGQWAGLVHRYAQQMVSGGRVDDPLWSLWERVRHDPAFPWDLPTLAEAAGMSTEHLRRQCQVHHACSPMRHVTDLRMQHAAAMLSTGDWSVANVSTAVGYATPYAFSNAFKRWSGKPPSTVRATSP